jgi:multidrug efflux pump subunit AcrB
VLEQIATDVSEIVSSVEGTIDVTDGIEETAPELRVVVDKDKSISKGLTVAQVFVQINSILSEDPSVTAISIDNKEYEVFIKENSEKADIGHNDLLSLEISNPMGNKVLLGDIASIEEASGFSSINRTNQQRNVTINADLAEGYNVGLVSDEISSILDGYEVPDGYSVEMGGETRMIGDSFNDLLLMLLLAVLFIYLIMVAQFQSLLSPFIVMFTIPLAFTGGFLGLMATGNPISIVAFVGLIVLAGVVVNNGIVFVDYVNKMREEGLSKYDALIKAGNDRMRPILMTALTTIFALSTLALGAGDGTEMMQPMAITAIGGLIYATLVTLVFVPVLYDAFHKNEK